MTVNCMTPGRGIPGTDWTARLRRMNPRLAWLCSRGVIGLAFILVGEVGAAGWRPPERFLQAVRYVESSNGQYTWGDNGRSLGDYQMSEPAWNDVNAWRKSRGLATYSYRRDIWHPGVSRSYAADYLSLLHFELSRRLNRAPSVAEVYAAYNMGLTGFAQCQFQLAKVNPTTVRKALLIKSLVAGR